MSRPIRAVVVYEVMRLPFQAGEGGSNPTPRLNFSTSTVDEINGLLTQHHYLGPVTSGRVCFAGWSDDTLVSAMVWRLPTARMLPSDGTWLELSRWCLTSAAGANAGSRMMSYATKWIRRNMPIVVTLVSYSDPVHGHNGSLYKACNWQYAPTHHSARYDADRRGYPSGHGSWNGVDVQSPKHRWTRDVRRNA